MPGIITEMPKKNRKKPVEQPPDPPKTAEPYVKPSTLPFPPWPKGGGKGNLTRPAELMEYWQSLPPEFIARTNFYVNREHPKLDRLQELTDEQREQIRLKMRRYPSKYIDKPAEPWDDLPDLRMAILRRYGSGDYKLYLNDCGAKTKESLAAKDPELASRNLCKCLISFWDPDYPPILDPSRPDKGIGILDWTHPANASYVAELRMKGIQAPNTKEESEVANDVVKTLVDQVGSLADKVAAHETDRLVDRIAEKVNPQGSNGQQSAASQIVDVLRAAKELNPPPAPVTAAASQETQMAGTLALVERIMSMKAENPMVDLYKLQLQATIDEMKEYRAETRRLQEQLAAKKDGDGNFESWIDKIEKIAPKVQGLLGLGGEKLTDVVHGRRRSVWEELALSAIPQLAPGLNAILGNAASYFLAPKTGGLGSPTPGQAALPAPNGQPAAPDPLEPLRQKVGGFLGANIGPLQKRFEAFVKGEPRDPDDAQYGNVDGSDFALWVHEEHGNQILQDARALGSANITAMFRNSPYWPAIAAHETKFAQFLDQILAFQPDEEEKPKDEEEKPVDLTEGEK